MTDSDLDEIDLTLMDLIAYVGRFGVCQNQIERLLLERLQTAFEIADEVDENNSIH